VSEIFAEDEREHLASLRHADPVENLVTRWRLLEEARPDLAHRRLGYVPLVLEHGWAVIAIPEEGFAYTIGLQYRFGQPELLVAAPSLDPDGLRTLLNALGRHVAQGERIAAGETVVLDDLGVSLLFHGYSEAVFQRYATGYLASFERFFEDREHSSGDTLPVLWSELDLSAGSEPRRTKAAAKKAPKKKVASKKKVVPEKKPAPKKAAPKKAAPKKAAVKKKAVAAKKKAAPKKAAAKNKPR
jgi:hypothetical protein